MAKKATKKKKKVTKFNVVISWVLNGVVETLKLRLFTRDPSKDTENQTLENEDLPGTTTQYSTQRKPGYYGVVVRAASEGEDKQKKRLRFDLLPDGTIKVLPPQEREGDLVSDLSVTVEALDDTEGGD